MLAKRWIAATAVLGVALVVWLCLPRATSGSGAAVRGGPSREVPSATPELRLDEEGARAPVESEWRDAATSTDDEYESEFANPGKPAPLGKLVGVVLGLAPSPEPAVVLCESFHAGRHLVREAAVGPEGDFEIANVDTTDLFLLRVKLGKHGRELARSGEIEFGAGELEKRVELIVGAHPTRLVVRVRDEAGAPVARATVRIEAIEFDDSAPRCLSEWVTAEATDPAGEVVFAPIAPAKWNVEVRSWEHTNVTAQADVREGQASELEVVLRAGLELRGRLITTSGAPAARERVAFTYPDSSSGVATWLLASVDDAGRFVVRHAPDAELTPQIERSLGRNSKLPRLTFGWKALPPVRPGRGEVDLIAPELCTLVGRCVGEPRPAELHVSVRFRAEFAQATVTLDSDGRFAVPLEPRTGRVRFELRPQGGEWPRDHAGCVVEAVFPPPGGVLDLGDVAFGSEPVLAGVIRSESGASTANLRVQLEFDPPHSLARREAWCDSQGRFEFKAAPNLPGALRIRYEPAGQAELRLENVAASARAGEVSLLLHPPARVAGRVAWNLAAHRGPPQIALIDPREDGRRSEVLRVVVRDSGDFELTAWPGSYELWLQWLGDDTWIEGPRVTLEFGRVTPLEWTVD